MPEPGRSDDELEQLVGKWGVEPGQLWTIGGNRLLVADCSVSENMTRLLNGRKAALVFTDPPYGVSYLSSSGKHAAITNDDRTGDD